MALTLELAQAVALGPFNPYIITPEWLARTGILPAGEAETRFKDIGEGTAFEFQRVSWEVDLRRLVVSSLEKDCGDLVAKVLDQLRHTPVRAVGNNFHFACTLDEWGTSPLPSLGKNLAEVATFEQTRWAGVIRREGVRIEVTVVSGDDSLAVLINHRRETDVRDFQIAIAAAKQFAHDRQISEQLLGSLLSQEVKK